MQSLHAQERTVENRPYCDLRPLHFGVIVGTHFQGLEFENVGTQRFTDEDGNVVEALVTCEQDRSDNGFHVGVLGELRLTDYLALGNSLKKGYVNQLKDKNLIKYAGSVSSAKSSIIALTFYFE